MLEIEPIYCIKRIIELVNRSYPDESRSHPRIAENPGDRHLSKRLAAIFRDRVQTADAIHSLWSKQFLLERPGS